jgi:hypothetical protein
VFSHKSFSQTSFSPTLFRFDLEPTPLPPVAGTTGGGYWVKKRDPSWVEQTYNLAVLHQQDQEVTELLVSLVTKGFFDEQGY